jgi:hypothetical protein
VLGDDALVLADRVLVQLGRDEIPVHVALRVETRERERCAEADAG